MRESSLFAFRNAVNISHLLATAVVKAGDMVIDATCGRGHDTALLARLVGESGKVLAFDIQEEAIASTRDLLAKTGLSQRVVLIKEDHAMMDHHITGPVSMCMFNLGYLPGSDQQIKTAGNSTLEAVRRALERLVEGGKISLVCYTGHPGGQEEFDLIRAFLAGIPQDHLEVMEIGFINQSNNPARLLVLSKLKGGIA